MVPAISKDQIDIESQYFVILKEPSYLKSLPHNYLPAGEPMLLIGSAAIELYEKLQLIELVEPAEAIADGIKI